ncbi:MAG: hypothetical protein IPN94_26050 [Sphingobacteriales bacterium]|nr:hypothetical protein [Sphingobacteriales bacterium]
MLTLKNGSISINEGVEIIYSPNSNFVGEDCFNYTQVME